MVKEKGKEKDKEPKKVLKPMPFGVQYDPELNCNWLIDMDGIKSVIGLPNTECSYTNMWANKLCPHKFDLNSKTIISDKDFEQLEQDPIAQFLLPFSSPNKNILFLSTMNFLQTHAARTYRAIAGQELGVFYLTKANKRKSSIMDAINKSNLSRPVMSLVDDRHHADLLPIIIDAAAMDPDSRLIVVGGDVPKYEYKPFMDFITITDKMAMDMTSLGVEVLSQYGTNKLIEVLLKRNIHE